MATDLPASLKATSKAIFFGLDIALLCKARCLRLNKNIHFVPISTPTAAFTHGRIENKRLII